MSNVFGTADSGEGTDSLAQFEESLGDPTYPGNDATAETLKEYNEQVEKY